MSTQPIIFEPTPRRIRVEFNKVMVADSTRAMIKIETPIPVYYLPLSDVRHDVLIPTDHTKICPRKGVARFWSIKVADRVAENAVWNYPEPLAGAPPLAPYAAFGWDLVDHWYEEDEEIFRHPRNPYKRVDAIRSTRHVQVIVGGKVVADTRRAVFLFETGLPTRYYIPGDDVQSDILRPSDRQTRCPYKGIAAYHAVTVGNEQYGDLVWYYPDPIEECRKITGLLAFFNEKIDAILVDGEVMPRPVTPWSNRETPLSNPARGQN
jgi:uncharacterized protein (DUF427 family)